MLLAFRRNYWDGVYSYIGRIAAEPIDGTGFALIFGHIRSRQIAHAAEPKHSSPNVPSSARRSRKLRRFAAAPLRRSSAKLPPLDNCPTPTSLKR